jgi:hypothetical protein
MGLHDALIYFFRKAEVVRSDDQLLFHTGRSFPFTTSNLIPRHSTRRPM